MTSLFEVTFPEKKLGFGGNLPDRFVNYGGGLEVDAAFKLTGNYGLKVTPLQYYKCGIMRRVPSLARIRQAVLINLADIAIPTTRYVLLARNYHEDNSQIIYAIRLEYVTGVGFSIYATVDSNTTAPMYTSGSYLLENQSGWNWIEWDWQASDTLGHLTIWTNGNQRWHRTVVNGSLRVAYPAIGAMYQQYAITGGFWIDAWYANDDGGAIDTVAPSVPTGLAAVAASNTAINLSWNPSTDAKGLAGYKVYRGGSLIATVAGTTYQDTGRADGTTYSYTVAAYDYAGNTSAQCAAVNGTTLDWAGSRNFDGTDDRIDWASVFNPAGGPVTMSVMLNLDTNRANQYFLNIGEGNNYGMWLASGAAAGVLQLGIMGTAWMARVTQPTVVTTGSWMNIAATYTGTFGAYTNIKLYKGGSEAAYNDASSVNGSGTENAHTGSWSVGGRIADDLRNMDGKACQIGVWDRVLTAQELANLAAGYAPSTIPSGLRFYWKGNTSSLANEIGGALGTADGTTQLTGAGTGPTIIYP